MMVRYMVVSKHTFLLKKMLKNEYIKLMLLQYVKKVCENSENAKIRRDFQQHHRSDEK